MPAKRTKQERRAWREKAREEMPETIANAEAWCLKNWVRFERFDPVHWRFRRDQKMVDWYHTTGTVRPNSGPAVEPIHGWADFLPFLERYFAAGQTPPSGAVPRDEAVKLVREMGWEYADPVLPEDRKNGRLKYQKPGTSRFVTIGKRSVCFYELVNYKAVTMRVIPTADLEKIRGECRDEDSEWCKHLRAEALAKVDRQLLWESTAFDQLRDAFDYAGNLEAGEATQFWDAVRQIAETAATHK